MKVQSSIRGIILKLILVKFKAAILTKHRTVILMRYYFLPQEAPKIWGLDISDYFL